MATMCVYNCEPTMATVVNDNPAWVLQAVHLHGVFYIATVDNDNSASCVFSWSSALSKAVTKYSVWNLK